MTLPKLYTKGSTDECYTPAEGVKPLLEYLDYSNTYWLPFDTAESEFVKVFREAGVNIVNTHIDLGEDFYSYEPTFKFDAIISNPPFTNKAKIFAKAISYGVPFALLMSNTWLNDSAPKKLFKDIDLQLLMFQERMVFKGMSKKITFSSSYFCRDFLPKQIVMKSLKEFV